MSKNILPECMYEGVSFVVIMCTAGNCQRGLGWEVGTITVYYIFFYMCQGYLPLHNIILVRVHSIHNLYLLGLSRG